MSIHVFSDASQRGDFYTGAYMIGDEGPFGIRLEMCESSTEAELRTSAFALYEARVKHPDEHLILHSDLQQVVTLMVRNRVFGASELSNALNECAAEIASDANYYKQHHKCHLHARKFAGICTRKLPTLRAVNQAKFVAIVDVLVAHDNGATEMRISQESGLSLGVTRKMLRFLETNKAAVCHFRYGVAGCDCSQIRWTRGEKFQELIRQVCREAA